MFKRGAPATTLSKEKSAKKIRWSDHKDAADFIEKEHEKLLWKKNKSVKSAIYNKGLSRGLWEEDDWWKQRVANKVESQYKTHVVMDESRSCPQ